MLVSPDAGGKWLQRSTKEIDRKRAQKIADQYEDAARQASLGFLAERQARKVIGEIYEISSREKLRSDSVQDFFTRWLGRVKVESSPKTYQRYEGVTARFLEWLGPRATLSVAHLSSVEIVTFPRLPGPAAFAIERQSLAGRHPGRALRAFDDRLVDVNEASRVPRLEDDPNASNSAERSRQEELRAILEVCDHEWRGMVLCGAYTGMRSGRREPSCGGKTSIWTGRELHFKTEKTGRIQSHPDCRTPAPSPHRDRQQR